MLLTSPVAGGSAKVVRNDTLASMDVHRLSECVANVYSSPGVSPERSALVPAWPAEQVPPTGVVCLWYQVPGWPTTFSVAPVCEIEVAVSFGVVTLALAYALAAFRPTLLASDPIGTAATQYLYVVPVVSPLSACRVCVFPELFTMGEMNALSGGTVL